MGRVEHGRKARRPLPLRASGVLVGLVEAMGHTVEIFGLGVYEVSEVPAPPALPTVQGDRIVVARLASHVDQAGLLDRTHQFPHLVQGNRRRDGTVYVLACAKSLDRLRPVHPPLSKDCNSVNVGIAQFIERGIRPRDSKTGGLPGPPLRDDLGKPHLLYLGMRLEEGDEAARKLTSPADANSDAHVLLPAVPARAELIPPAAVRLPSCGPCPGPCPAHHGCPRPIIRHWLIRREPSIEASPALASTPRLDEPGRNTLSTL